MPRKILILGGTGDARELASQLVARGHVVTTSFAGVTSAPKLPAGEIRFGGFGGADGLRKFLTDEHFNVLVDATHPYAQNISANTALAVQGLDILHLRLERPAWQPVSGDEWISVSGIEEAAQALPSGSCALITIGRKSLALFFKREDLRGIVRCIEPPAENLPHNWHLILERPPFSIVAEMDLIKSISATHLVTKNAGGEGTYAKIAAARTLNLPVVMVSRPAKNGGLALRNIADVIGKCVE